MSAINELNRLSMLKEKGTWSSYHTASYVRGTKLKQLFQSGSQVTVAHSSEVTEGEEVKVLSQMTRQAVELVQYPEGHTDTHTLVVSAGFEMIVRLKNMHKQTSYSLAKRQVLKRFFM